MDILAWNAPAATLITDFARIPAADRNYVSITFTAPGMSDLYEDWESVARTCVGILRREAAENPDDPELAGLVGRLSIADDDFRRWWAEHRVAEQNFGAKVMVHPKAGRMSLSWDSFTYAGAARQQLILWSAVAGSPDAHALSTLVSLTRSELHDRLTASRSPRTPSTESCAASSGSGPGGIPTEQAAVESRVPAFHRP